MRNRPRAARSAALGGQPGTVLESESPYGSRRLVVEYDGATTAAYLHDAGAVLGAAWIANHEQAPQSADLSRLNAGQAPLMPAAHTKHPAGRPPLDARTLRALWFEEATGSRSSRAGSCSRSSPAGPTWPGACPATAGT